MFRALVLVVGFQIACAPDARADDADPWFGRDKFAHYVVATSLATETYVIAVNTTRARWHAIAIAAGITLVVGAGKEGWDALGHGTASWRDFTWDAIGAATGIGLAWGLDLLIRGVDAEHPLFRAPAMTF